jgi:hypothetical protein
LFTSDQPVAEDTTYTTHNKDKRQTHMPSAGFKSATLGIKRLKAYALDRMVSLIGFQIYSNKYSANKIVKEKAIPVQAWTGPEGSRRLRLPDLKTIGT